MPVLQQLEATVNDQGGASNNVKILQDLLCGLLQVIFV